MSAATITTVEARSVKAGMVTPDNRVITKVTQVTYLVGPAFRVEYNRGKSTVYLPTDDIEVTDDPRALDVWFSFEEEDDEEPRAEANVYPSPSGYEVAWSLTAVGLITRVWFATYEGARAWLVGEGFEDYSNGEELSE
jgi:hypothetical protein